MACHDWADGHTGGKKEIGYIDLVFIIILGYGLSILVEQGKVGYAMVFLNMLNGTINQLEAYLCRLVNRKNNFGLQDLIKYRDDYYG